MTNNIRSLTMALISLSALSFGQTPNISVTGIELGMTMAQAKSRLSGYDILQRSIPTNVYAAAGNPFAGTSPYTIVTADKGIKDYYVLEAVNGRIAYVARKVTIDVSQAVDINTYRKQLAEKYGPASPRSDGQRWQFDASNHLIPLTPVNMFCFQAAGGVGHLAVLKGGFPIDYNYILAGSSVVPDYKTSPLCQKSLSVQTFGLNGRITPVHMFQFVMVDAQPFAEIAARREQLANAQKEEQRRKLEQRKGPI